MATRRQAREWALQLLFQLDLNPSDPEAVMAAFWKTRRAEPEARCYAENLVRGVRENLAALDERLSRCAEHWALDRMATVERNVLRMAVYEMLHCPDVPPVVSINEAVDIAKFFSSSESGRFVNGILDRVRKEIDRPPRRAARPPGSGT